LEYVMDAAYYRQKAAKARFRETLEEAVAEGALEPLDTELTAAAMLACLEGILLVAKARDDPEVVLTPGPAIGALRIERRNREETASVTGATRRGTARHCRPRIEVRDKVFLGSRSRHGYQTTEPNPGSLFRPGH
jgi:hypothetical protein